MWIFFFLDFSFDKDNRSVEFISLDIYPHKRLKTQHNFNGEQSLLYHDLYRIIQSVFSSIVTKSVATKDVY